MLTPLPTILASSVCVRATHPSKHEGTCFHGWVECGLWLMLSMMPIRLAPFSSAPLAKQLGWYLIHSCGIEATSIIGGLFVLFGGKTLLNPFHNSKARCGWVFLLAEMLVCCDVQVRTVERVACRQQRNRFVRQHPRKRQLECC